MLSTASTGLKRWIDSRSIDRSWVIGLIVVILLLDLVRRISTGETSGTRVLRYAWNGIVFGLIVGLGGVGLSLTYDLLDFANFAHGDYITVAAFVGWGTTYLVAGLGEFDAISLFFLGAGGTVYPRDLGVSVTGTPIAIIIGLVVAAVAGALFALLIDRLVYRSMRLSNAITLLIASIGIAFILRYLVVYFFTQDTFGLTVSATQWSVGFPSGEVSVNAPSVLLVAVAAVLVVALHLLLTQTKLGKAMRAMGDNRDLARVTGIPSEQIIRFTWLIGGALAGTAGFMAVLLQGTISFQVGWTLLLLIFAGVIMGGIGSVYGALAGGLIIGLITRLSLVWIPASFTEAMAFVVMIVVLLTRPQGIFGRARG